MNVKFDKSKNEIVIRMPVTGPTPSASGKSLTLASTRGNKVSGAEYDGQPITVGVNAYIPRG
jgi:hypothetical protein